MMKKLQYQFNLLPTLGLLSIVLTLSSPAYSQFRDRFESRDSSTNSMREGLREQPRREDKGMPSLSRTYRQEEFRTPRLEPSKNPLEEKRAIRRNVLERKGTIESVGGMDAGGGKGRMCLDATKNTLSFETLDLWEGRNAEFSINLGPGKTLSEKLNFVLERLSRVSRIKSYLWKTELKDLLQREADFSQSNTLLPVTTDTGLTIPSEGCMDLQIVTQVDPQKLRLVKPGIRYIFNPKLLSLLDLDSQAALLIHEIVYKEARLNKNFTSESVRYIVALLCSDRMDSLTLKEWKEYEKRAGLNVEGDGPAAVLLEDPDILAYLRESLLKSLDIMPAGYDLRFVPVKNILYQGIAEKPGEFLLLEPLLVEISNENVKFSGRCVFIKLPWVHAPPNQPNFQEYTQAYLNPKAHNYRSIFSCDNPQLTDLKSGVTKNLTTPTSAREGLLPLGVLIELQKNSDPLWISINESIGNSLADKKYIDKDGKLLLSPSSLKP